MHFDGKLRTWLGVSAELAGLGSRPAVATTAGSARVAQEYGIFGGSYRFGSGQGLGSFVALSAGALHTSVQGEAGAPRQGHTVTQWSLLWDASAGASMHLQGRYYASLAVHVQLTEPYVAIHILDAIVATSGRPNLVLTLTVGAWL